MLKDGKILFGKNGEKEVFLDLSMANRHGLISGATGTGKTVSLKVLAESFSDAGVPVFLADIKGDLASVAQMGADEKHVTQRVASMDLAADGFSYRKYPAAFWDLYGEKGMPLRTTISEMGPILLSRVLGLNDTQSDILSVVFKIADDNQLLLIDTKDLKAMLNYVSEHADEYEQAYGRIAKVSLTAILRAVVSLETQGADRFFGEPALTITDLLQQENGQGVISVLDCRKLILHPDMYSTLLLWMLSELYEMLPEVGDLARPKLVFFFDEAHMLFDNASKDLLQRIGQTIKLIRSKGVGIFFVTQDPGDIPEDVMGQLGNKIQHALHAYSPKELKQVRIAAETYRPNPAFDTGEAIQSLGTGEAVISFLDDKGIPGMAEKVQVLPPQSWNGSCDDSLRDAMIKSSLLYSKYAVSFDRDSAYEFLQRRQLNVSVQQPTASGSAPEAGQPAVPEVGAGFGQQNVPGMGAGFGQQNVPGMGSGSGQMTALESAMEEARKAKADAAAAQKEAERQIRETQKAAEKQALQAQKAAAKQQAEAQKALEREEKRKKTEMSRVAKTISGTVGRELGKNVGSSFGSFGKRLGGNVGAQLGRSIMGTLFKT